MVFVEGCSDEGPERECVAMRARHIASIAFCTLIAVKASSLLAIGSFGTASRNEKRSLVLG